MKNGDNKENNLNKSKWRLCYKYSPNCNQIDAYSRILFPFTFILFIISYVLYVTFRG